VNHPKQTLKTCVSVAEMSRMTGLSRARFYQLHRVGVFPSPKHDPATGRPFYDEEQQNICLDVRRRNCGVNGKTVLFYAPRNQITIARPQNSRPMRTMARRSPSQPKHHALISALAALGISATAVEVGSSLAELFPTGVGDTDESAVLRQVFLHLRRKNTADNVGR